MPYDINEEIKSRVMEALNGIMIDCPECECIGDDQYQCGMCGYGGGNGQIEVTQYVTINK